MSYKSMNGTKVKLPYGSTKKKRFILLSFVIILICMPSPIYLLYKSLLNELSKPKILNVILTAGVGVCLISLTSRFEQELKKLVLFFGCALLSSGIGRLLGFLPASLIMISALFYGSSILFYALAGYECMRIMKSWSIFLYQWTERIRSKSGKQQISNGQMKEAS